MDTRIDGKFRAILGPVCAESNLNQMLIIVSVMLVSLIAQELRDVQSFTQMLKMFRPLQPLADAPERRCVELASVDVEKFISQVEDSAAVDTSVSPASRLPCRRES
jgi:hypothetical protein